MSKYPVHKDLKKLWDFIPPLNRATISAAEKLLDRFFYSEKSDGRVTVKKALINGYKGTKVKALVYEPVNCREKAPCIVFCHGGGFVFKASPYHYALARKYAVKTDCKVIMPDYSLAPEHPFPYAVEECYNVYMWALRHAGELGIDKNRIAVYGDSAGGNIAAAVSLMARDRKAVMPCLQMLIYPAADRRMTTRSMEEYTDTPVWNSVKNKKMWEIYLPDENAEHIEYASPIEAGDLTHLPDAYVETAEFDCLHDEGIAYAERLMLCGNNVTVFQTKGTVHGFEIVTKSELVSESVRRRVSYLKSCFYGE